MFVEENTADSLAVSVAVVCCHLVTVIETVAFVVGMCLVLAAMIAWVS